MKIQKESTIRVPIAEIVKIIKEEHHIDVSDASPQIIGDYLIFQKIEGGEYTPPIVTVSKKRKSRKRRNRMKTRGWKVVGKIKTDSGQIANVYEPFVRALKGKSLSKQQQEEIVERILRSNGNKPGPESIEYFLNSTLKYIEESE